MPETTPTIVQTTVKVNHKVGIGPTSIGGSAFAILAAVGAIYAGIAGNDTATITGGVTALLSAITVLGGRYAQAVALIQTAAPKIEQAAHDVAQPASEA